MFKYILNEKGEPIPCDDLHKWCMFTEQTKARIVAKTKIGNSEISTVFLGLDHNFGGGVSPILWETMVFGGAMDEEQTRCSGTRKDAETMHEQMCQRVKGEIK
jgi:hypothetical protein